LFVVNTTKQDLDDVNIPDDNKIVAIMPVGFPTDSPSPKKRKN